jgi:hypothetical protein
VRRRVEAIRVQLVHVFGEAREDFVDVGVGLVLCQMGVDL